MLSIHHAQMSAIIECGVNDRVCDRTYNLYSNYVCDRTYLVTRCMQQLFSAYPERWMQQPMALL